MEQNQFNEIYTVNPQNVPWGYKNADLDLAHIVERLRLSPRSKVIDIGCGNGKNTTYLGLKKFKIYGFDISSRAVSIAKERVPLGNFIVADAAHLPYANKYFDIAFDWGLFHCIPREKRTCVKKEICRILKPKGCYIMRVFSRPAGHLAGTPLFHENLDQTGRTAEQDLSRQQFPVWSFTFHQISNIFSGDFIIEDKLYSGNRIIAIMSKK